MIPTTLLLLDIQNDFFDGGAYALVGAQAAAKKAGALLQCFRDHAGHHIHTQHENRANGMTYCVPSTEGIRINDQVAHYEGEPIVYKKTFDAFYQTDLQEQLLTKGTKRLLLCGMPLETTIAATARTASSLGYEVVIVEDACASRFLTEEPPYFALKADLQTLCEFSSAEKLMLSLSIERDF